MTSEALQALYQLRARLHACPELSGREVQTLRALREFLTAHTTLEVRDMGGWLLALHREGEGLPTLGFRADTDAIPDGEGGARHGCGHDGHSAVLCGLGLALEGRRLGRNIALIFQPAEETGAGAKRICETWPGLEALSRIYGFHNIPGFPVGALLARRGCFASASAGLITRVQGRPAHAACPEQGANPAGLLCALTLALPEMIDETRGGGDRLLMQTVVGLRLGGENFGLSASEGQLCLTLRGDRQADIDALAERIRRFTREGCASEGMTCAFETRDAFPDTTSHDAVVDAALAAWQRAGLHARLLDAPMRWSEDFGWYLRRIPGAYFGIGSGERCPGLHTAGYAFDDAVIAPAVRALLYLAEA